MSTSPPSDPTAAYYAANADRFAAESVALDATDLYEPFLALVPPGGLILDAGCGSGRDALAFRRLGYAVTAFDASPELARLAAEHTHLPVEVLRFQDMAFDGEFDGVWACSSLLHVPRAEMPDVLTRVARALRPGGVCFMSFKLGDGEAVRDGRFFNDYTETSLVEEVRRAADLEPVRTWLSADRRPGRENQTWVNLIARRRHDK